MKVVHFGVFTPHGSGQFSTIIDLIKAERQQGIDAYFVDCGRDHKAVCRVNFVYDDIICSDPMEAFDADVLVRHSVIPPEIEALEKPSLMMLHGRPENSFLLEFQEKLPIYSIVYDRKFKKHYKAFVTFWKPFKFHWELFVENHKVFYVPAMVDIKKYSPGGKKFDFGPKGGRPNIVCVDIWREDTTPYNVMHAAMKFIKERCSQGRLHVFGLPANVKILDQYIGVLGQNRLIGHAWGKVDFLDEVYRAADILVTPHVIATRVVREAMACGCPIVAGGGSSYTKYNADPRNVEAFCDQIEKCWWDVSLKREEKRKESREKAKKLFNLEQAGVEMKKILDCVAGMNKRRLKLTRG